MNFSQYWVVDCEIKFQKENLKKIWGEVLSNKYSVKKREKKDFYWGGFGILNSENCDNCPEKFGKP